MMSCGSRGLRPMSQTVELRIGHAQAAAKARATTGAGG